MWNGHGEAESKQTAKKGGAGRVQAVVVPGLKDFILLHCSGLIAHDALRNTNGVFDCIEFNPGIARKLQAGA